MTFRVQICSVLRETGPSVAILTACLAMEIANGTALAAPSAANGGVRWYVGRAHAQQSTQNDAPRSTAHRAWFKKAVADILLGRAFQRRVNR